MSQGQEKFLVGEWTGTKEFVSDHRPFEGEVFDVRHGGGQLPHVIHGKLPGYEVYHALSGSERDEVDAQFLHCARKRRVAE